jgi:coenzyme Q-binding protein COQ10
LRRSLTRLLPYAPDDLFQLVGDVDRYPEFVPWLTALRTWNHRSVGEGIDQLDAEAAVGFAMVRERFTTRVRRDAGARQIDVALLSGPFKTLRNRWRFTPDGPGTRVEFDIDFAFKSKTLSALLAANADHAVERVLACFEGRARALFAPRPEAAQPA